jgi:hypothetical protein
MKRRPFIKSLATIGAIGLASNNNLKANEIETIDALKHGDLIQKPTELLKKLENEHIIFEWMSDASATVTSKKSKEVWKMGPVAIQEEEEIDHGHVWIRQERSICEQYAGRFKGELEGENIRFYLLDDTLKVIGSFLVSAVLENEWISFDIKQIDESIPNLTFPTPIENDQMVLPNGAGRIVRTPLPARYFNTWVTHLNMRFCAGLKNNGNGYMAIFDEGYQDSGLLLMNMSAMPVWLKSLGKWNSPRRIKYTFTSGGYVGIAQKYRLWAESKGLVKTLQQKIKETPRLANLIGGRQISVYQAISNRAVTTMQNSLKSSADIEKYQTEKAGESMNIMFTFADLKTMFAELKSSWGLKKGMFNIRGWISGGYDYSHPDIWPPDPKLGKIEELKALCNQGENYFTSLHDNYMDSYRQNPSFPNGVIIDKRGKLMKGGMWGGGQAYIMQYKKSMEYAKRNWEQIKTLGAQGVFEDTTTASQLYENYEKGNLMTRADDERYKIEFMKFFKDQKQILGSEETADFGIPYVDYLESRHTRKAGETIPLWSLVFHDCVMNARYVDDTNMKVNEKPHLEDMLWGYFILFRMGIWGQKEWRSQKEFFQSSLPADEWFGQIATAKMTNHEFLTENFQLEKTTFSNGKSITVNFSKEPITHNGVSYKPLSYTIS